MLNFSQALYLIGLVYNIEIQLNSKNEWNENEFYDYNE